MADIYPDLPTISITRIFLYEDDEVPLTYLMFSDGSSAAMRIDQYRAIWRHDATGRAGE
jgi:hypothetical protein